MFAVVGIRREFTHANAVDEDRTGRVIELHFNGVVRFLREFNARNSVSVRAARVEPADLFAVAVAVVVMIADVDVIAVAFRAVVIIIVGIESGFAYVVRIFGFPSARRRADYTRFTAVERVRIAVCVPDKQRDILIGIRRVFYDNLKSSYLEIIVFAGESKFYKSIVSQLNFLDKICKYSINS